MKKSKAVKRKPIGIFSSVIGLLLFLGATIPVHAQSFTDRYYAQHPRYNDPLRLLGPPSLTPGLPGEKLVRAAETDLYACNFKAAIPLLEKGVQAGNLDAMCYLGTCYCYGFGVPRDLEKSRQLSSRGTRIAQARALRIDRKQQEDRERSIRAFLTLLAASAASSSTQSSAPAKPKHFEGPVVATPWGLGWRGPFNSVYVP